MPVVDTIDVYHGDYHENKHLFQQERPDVFRINQKVYYSFHGKGSSRLARMNACTYKHNWLLESFGSATLREQSLVEKFLALMLRVLLIMRSYGEQVDGSFFWTMDKDFFVEVKVLIAVILVETVQEVDVSGVGVGKGEGEFYLVVLIFERKLENDLKLACLTHDERAFSADAAPGRPLLLVELSLSKDGTVTFGSLGLDGDGDT